MNDEMDDVRQPGSETGTAAAAELADLVNLDPSVATVWSDVGCPWATLALSTLADRASARGVPLVIDHRAFPLELFNRMPTPKILVDAEVVAIAGAFPALGWQLWGAAEYTYPGTLLPSLEAVQAAKAEAVGGLPASTQLDAALRRAYFVESRAISVHPVLLEVAAECDMVDAEALAEALSEGQGRREVYRDWRLAGGWRVQGSPHLFAAGGAVAMHNPGVRCHWTGRPPLDFPVRAHGVPVLDSYDASWADELLDRLQPAVS